MKPIAFSRPMVLARRAGRKTLTRRIVKPQPASFADWVTCDLNNVWRAGTRSGEAPHMGTWTCPYGEPGDQLWVREDFQILPREDHPHVIESADGVFARYLADGQVTLVELDPHELTLWLARKFPYRKTPGRFMYQSLARDKPTLVSIRVERLQDITEADAIAEGIGQFADRGGYRIPFPDGKSSGWQRHPQDAFRQLWSVLHGPESWTANPWVWVLELTPFANRNS